MDVNNEILNKIVVYTTKSLRKIFEENLRYSNLIFEILVEEEIKNWTYESELLYSFELFYKEHKDPLILDVPNLLLHKVKNLEEFIEKYIKKKRIPVNVEKIRQRV